MPLTVFATAGESRLEVEEPDLVIYRICGTLTGPELRALRAAEGRWNVGKQHLLVLVDSSNQTASTFETRKVSMEPAIGTKNRAIALFGGTSAVRVFTNMTMRALGVLTGGKLMSRMFGDEASALQWLYEQRPLLISRRDYPDEATLT